jgi:hypothetical protein
MTDAPPLSAVGVLALVFGTLILGLIVHEVGHALAAHLVGFRVRLVRVGWLTATATPAGWRLQLQRGRTLSGWVNAIPVRPEHLRIRDAVFVAGGPAAHLLLSGAALGAATVWRGALVPAVVLLLTLSLELVPLGLRREGRWLDGDWLLAWSVRPRLAAQRVALAALHLAIETGQRPREWDERWARLATLGQRRHASSTEVAGDILGYTWALDRGLIDDAGRLLARAFAGRCLLPADQCAAVIVEAAFFVARYRGRRALATRLLDVAPAPSSEMAVDLERARAAIQLAAGDLARLRPHVTGLLPRSAAFKTCRPA